MPMKKIKLNLEYNFMFVNLYSSDLPCQTVATLTRSSC